MNIRWRLALVAVQLAVLMAATYFVTGRAVVPNAWFLAGLLAVVINRQLLEPYYARPADVIANTAIFLFLYFITDKGITSLGWDIAAIAFGIAAALAIVGVTVGRRSSKPRPVGIATAARLLSQLATAEVIYSTVFFLDLFTYASITGREFWALVVAWTVLMVLGHINWQRLWTAVAVGGPTCMVESLLGPSVITVTANALPAQGSWVSLASSSVSADGVMLRRIFRQNDVWGQVHVTNVAACEKLVADGVLDIQEKVNALELVGSVDEGSSDTTLRFIATKDLEVGNVVAVPLGRNGDKVIYQLTSASVEPTSVKGGSHLFVRAFASQIGQFVPAQQAFQRHLWVPAPGAPVFSGDINNAAAPANAVQAHWERLGNVIGTTLPVFIDLASMSEGHLVILGMTKMGKSTLAERLARRLAQHRAVVICDLTGEYVAKKGFPQYAGNANLTAPGVCVCEPDTGEVPAKKLLAFMKSILTRLATPEYQAGNPFPRTLIIDEAHQFIPEPAGIGFNAPGRDESYEIGLLMMQIRKYGISVILISQRTAVVAKSALSQCENLIAFRSVDQTGLDYLEALGGAQVRYLLPRLTQRQALAIGPAISSDSPVALDIA